ncbi:hypothetical protein DFJ74DRAFT_677922 [Hyaloraphidium curvatum]|nr:hypothetical protein DFJ74DRAFT_677922 [Hyaloraphidium curvatum]
MQAKRISSRASRSPEGKAGPGEALPLSRADASVRASAAEPALSVPDPLSLPRAGFPASRGSHLWPSRSQRSHGRAGSSGQTHLLRPRKHRSHARRGRPREAPSAASACPPGSAAAGPLVGISMPTAKSLGVCRLSGVGPSGGDRPAGTKQNPRG